MPELTDRQACADDGQPLVFRVHGEAAGHAPFLTLHGLFSSVHHWSAFVDHFAPQRPVVSWEYRGHGGQPTPARLPSTVARFADDAHAVWQASEQPPAVVVGLSFGVQVALELWRRHPESVRALVLVCGTPGRPLDRLTRSRRFRRVAIRGVRAVSRVRPLSRRLLAAVGSPVGVRLAREVAYLTGGAHRRACPPEVLEGLFHHVGGLSPALIAAGFAAFVEHDAWETLPSIRVPTLLLAADQDGFAPLSVAEEMHRAIPDSRLVRYRGYSHLVQVERSADVHREIEAFLRAHDC